MEIGTETSSEYVGFVTLVISSHIIFIHAMTLDYAYLGALRLLVCLAFNRISLLNRQDGRFNPKPRRAHLRTAKI